jgi:hypothetical protein
MERVKYIISGVIRDCLDYPHEFVEYITMYFVPEQKDLFSIEVTPGGNYHFGFEVFSEEQREKVKSILDKTLHKYEEMEICIYE